MALICCKGIEARVVENADPRRIIRHYRVYFRHAISPSHRPLSYPFAPLYGEISY